MKIHKLIKKLLPMVLIASSMSVVSCRSALYHAAERGDKYEVNRLLDNGANIEAPIDPISGSLCGLGFAVMAYPDLLMELLTLANWGEWWGGEPVCAKFFNRGRRTPVEAAAANGHYDVVKLLIERGAKVREDLRWDVDFEDFNRL